MFKLSRFAGVLSFLLLAACFGGDETSAPAPTETGGEEAGRGGERPVADAEIDDRDAVRFFSQASFGANPAEIEELKAEGIEAWIAEQVSLPIEPYQPRVAERAEEGWVNDNTLQALFWERAVHGEDQLRQRMAFALQQITVASMRDPALSGRARAFSAYADVLQDHALGNYCDLVRDVTLSPVMGLYLTHLGNRKADPETGFVPDENYAREVMQLFTIGLVELTPGGEATDRETYTIEDVQGLAAVFTGLSWADTDFYRPRITDYNRYLPMESFRAQHEDAAKSFLGTTVNVGNDAIVSVEAALDHLLSHPNVAPFIAKQLIQKLVTSNPSPGYVERVAEAFEAGRVTLAGGVTVGDARRCDLAATAAAILTDPEARDIPDDDSFGKIRSPVLRLAQLIRAFREEQSVTGTGPIPNARVLDRLEDSDRLGMNAFTAPSVFSFYRPGYVGPGTESAEAGLLTPEYQLAITPSLVGYINVAEDFIDGPPLKSGEPNVAAMNFAALERQADDPEALVEEVNRLLLGGSLAEENRRKIVEAVSTVTIGQNNPERDRNRRVQTALLMAVVSPEYVVQR